MKVVIMETLILVMLIKMVGDMRWHLYLSKCLLWTSYTPENFSLVSLNPCCKNGKTAVGSTKNDSAVLLAPRPVAVFPLQGTLGKRFSLAFRNPPSQIKYTSQRNKASGNTCKTQLLGRGWHSAHRRSCPLWACHASLTAALLPWAWTKSRAETVQSFSAVSCTY